MFNMPSPRGKVKRFIGDILKSSNKDPFGFFYVKVTTPKYLKVPILQTRLKTKYGGYRTISPLGSWNGWYFSEELKNAMKYGYKFEVQWGYLFEKGFMFKEYVRDLYELKKFYKRDSVEYIICKFILNSLYGRFGMDPIKEIHIILKGAKNIENFIIDNNVTDSECLGEHVELVSYIPTDKSKIISLDNENILSKSNISLPISSSISAYARIKMSDIKHKYADNLYYSDTDSVDLDINLDTKYVSNELGDFKHEYTLIKKYPNKLRHFL